MDRRMAGPGWIVLRMWNDLLLCSDADDLANGLVEVADALIGTASGPFRHDRLVEHLLQQLLVLLGRNHQRHVALDVTRAGFSAGIAVIAFLRFASGRFPDV